VGAAGAHAEDAAAGVPGTAVELGRVTPLERGSEFAAGTRLVPPVAFWHALRPRDEEASALLRALSDEQAGELLRAGAEALAEHAALVAAAGGPSAATATTDTGKPVVPSADVCLREAVSRCLPALTEPHLLAGVTALVRAVLRLAGSAAAFVAPPVERSQGDRRRVEGMFADLSPEHGDDQTLRDAVAGFTHHQRWWGGGRWSALRQIRSVNHVLSGKPADGRPLPERSRLTSGGWVSDDHTIPGIGVVWPSVLDVLRPLAYRAASPVVSETHREALLLLLEAVADGPLAAPGGGLREIVLSEPHDKQERVGQVLRQGGRTVVVLGNQNVDRQNGRVNWLALDHDPAGVFGAVAHFTLEKETAHPPVFPADALTAVTRLIRDKGAAPWQPEAPDALARTTGGGLGPLQAALLLAGTPAEMSPEMLTTIGLKPRQRDLASGLLGSLWSGDRAALVGALLPEVPGDLWTAGPDTAAAGRLWAERLGGVVRLPEDIMADLDLPEVPAVSAEAVLNPRLTPWLSRTTVQRPDKDGDLAAADPAALPGQYDLTRAVHTLAALAYGLPYGHRLRAALPEGLAALRARVADPGLLLDLGISWAEKGQAAPLLRKAYGLPAAGGADADGLTRLGDALVLIPRYGDQEAVLVRPAGLEGPDDAVFGLVEGLVGAGRGEGLQALRTILGEDLARALEAGTDPEERPAGYAQDPTAAVPGLVGEVAEAHGLGEDAAALYLQLLALPDPTDRNCARWTGWRPARMKKARAELAATGLVVEAKRPRAGRSLFLPCGWLDLKAPALPVEIWKEGLYPVRTRSRAVPLVPVPELFTRAVARVRAGDAPAYEELTTRATRKGRRR
jgi:hypothetical protein